MANKQKQMLAVWGSPGAGKTVTAVKLALELSKRKKNVVLVFTDVTAPTLPAVVSEKKLPDVSVGELLAAPGMTQEQVLKTCVPCEKNPYISFLGYKAGENVFTYAEYSKEKAVDMLVLLRHIADYVIVDCTSVLPGNVLATAALEVADEFNAIGSCLKKEYTYRIYNSRIKNPFYVNRAYFYPKKLDEAVMDAAARAFEGTHDFRAVRSVGTETKTTVRTVHYCRVTRRGELLELKVCADGFLYNMVRAITGTVLYAAEGKLTAEDIPKILDSGDRTLAGPTVPPGGLYMTRLWYEDERLND